MTKIDNFKAFVKQNPSLITYVRDKTKTWQDLYELYDLYGEEQEVWNKYLNKEKPKEESTQSPLNNILNMAKNIDANKLQEGLSSIQKAVDLFGGLLIKDKDSPTKDYKPRPVYKRFDD